MGKQLYWHFLQENRTLGYGDNRAVQAGKTYRYEGEQPPRMCRRGMHASRRSLDALKYAPGPVVCRVDLLDAVAEDDDKTVAQGRKIIWMADASRVLHEFACLCAEDALRRMDIREGLCWAAIRIKRLWLVGKASDEELSAAWSAARSATWDVAAWSAARNVARDAAAWDVAWDVAGDAAWSAARDAAPGSAAWSAAREKQNRRLTAMLNKLKGQTDTTVESLLPYRVLLSEAN